MELCQAAVADNYFRWNEVSYGCANVLLLVSIGACCSPSAMCRCVGWYTSRYSILTAITTGLSILLIELQQLSVLDGCALSGVLTLVAMAAMLYLRGRQAGRFGLDDGRDRLIWVPSLDNQC
jgi:hypothetical protein